MSIFSISIKNRLEKLLQGLQVRSWGDERSPWRLLVKFSAASCRDESLRTLLPSKFFHWWKRWPEPAMTQILRLESVFFCFSFISYFFLPCPVCLSPSPSHSFSCPPSLPTMLSHILSLPADFALPCAPPLSTHFFHGFFGCLFPLSSPSSSNATQHIWRQQRLTEPVSLLALPPPLQLT